ncbi:FecCD family ABC transporter permease [Pantoea sp. FN060301]|uniref:FecCD family ABC transporter permease n=1 Tax=Pantoea sp. FN060301 TaxID=3420380 RepID=UPI003D178373
MSREGRRFFLVLTASTVLLAGLAIWSLMQGAVPLTFRQLAGALGFPDVPVSPMVTTIVLELRFPRMLLALLTGAGLAMTGALLQTTTRNELADPFLFGLSSGASAGAVLVITRFGDWLGDLTLPLSAFAGGILSAVAVLTLFHINKHRRSEQLIISGLAVSFLFSAFTSYQVFAGDRRAASSVMFWSLGGLGLARWDNLLIPLASVILLAGFVALRWRSLDGLLAGEQTAASLGINISALRTETFICCALATSLLVSLTGVIGFVGLMVPHLARRITGVRHALLLPLAAVLGAILLCGGDILSRTLIKDQELPVGIITAGVGGFFIIVMLMRRTTGTLR